MLVAFNGFFIEGAPSAATAPPVKRYEHLTGVVGKGNERFQLLFSVDGFS